MLQKLKVECGVNTMNKISKMFTDIEMSKELQQKFSQSTQGKQLANNTGIEFSAEVLTNGTWPTDPSPICVLPKQMKVCIDQY